MPDTPAPSPAGDSTDWLPPTPEELQALLPQYEITMLIGRGGMGAVYRGKQVHLDRAVAIKILPPGLDETDSTFSERFRNEALAMAKLNHPGLVAVYDFGKTRNGMLYIVMEFVDGTDVAHMMAQKGRLSSDHAMAITAHVCDALKYAHERGIVHRDIKPANIMVGYDGVVKVADFGLAKTSQSGQSTGLTQSGLAMGTMHYIAPEALTLGTSVDQRADIYAMGVMLYHMLTGGLPHGMFELPSLQVPGLDPRYDAIISRAMRNDRDRRYQSVVELRHDLDAILTRPVTQVNADSKKAPAALNTTARPQRPAGPPLRSAAQPQRNPQKQTPPPPPPKQKSNLGFWVPVVGVAVALVAAYLWLAHPERKTIQRVEGEAMEVFKATGGETLKQGMGAFRTSIWSGALQLLWVRGAKNDVLTLHFPVNEAGKQRVKAVFSMSTDFTVVDVALDGKQVAGAPFDLQAEVATISDILDFGVFNLEQGEHELTIRLLDTHGRDYVGAGAYVTALDYIQLEPPVLKAPLAKPGTDVAPVARPSASQCSSGDHVKHMNDGKVITEPNSGHPERMTWYPRKGGMEWAQLEWETPQTINECQVVWFEDHNSTMPVFWRLLYREDSGAWVPVEATIPTAVRDQWSVVKFPAVKTTALRISVQCQEGWSAGICHWKAIAADPSDTAEPPESKHDLSLVDLSPLHAQCGWGLYRANHYDSRDDRDGRGVFLGGQVCTQYLWAHPMSRTEFAIPSGYTCFTATGIGPSYKTSGQPVGGYGSWKYVVEVDGKTLLDSNELRSYAGQELPIAVTFPAGSKRLTLVTDSAGDGNSDHAFWAYPTLGASGASAKSASATAASGTPSRVVFTLPHTPLEDLKPLRDLDLTQYDKPATEFRIVPGLADPTVVSLEMMETKNFFVRHWRTIVWAHERPAEPEQLFNEDATWKIARLGDGKARFESFNYPGTFLSVKDDGLLVQLRDAPLAQSIFLLQ